MEKILIFSFRKQSFVLEYPLGMIHFAKGEIGMPYWMQDTLLTAPQSLVFAAAALFALRPQRPVMAGLSASVAQTALYLLLRHLLPLPYWLASLLLFPAPLAALLPFCKGKRKLCVVFFLLCVSVMLFAEFLTGLISFAFFPPGLRYSPETVQEHLVLFKILYLILLLPLAAVFLWLWAKFLRRNSVFPDRSLGYLLIPFFLSQAGFLLVLMYLLITEQLLQSGTLALALFSCLFFLLSNIALYGALSGMLRQQQARQKQDALLHAMEGQFDTFQQLLHQEEARSKLQHDLNNQLQTAYALFAGGQLEKAASHIQQLTALTLKETPPRYCAEPTINALLWQKSGLCREADIRLDVSAALSPDFSMDPLVLCSLFGNLLDNAIQACRCHPKEVPGRIRLRISQEAGFLLVSCENTVFPNREDREERRHWGMQILEDIAALYDGTMKVQQTADRYQVQISLQIHQEPRCVHGDNSYL